MLITCFQEHSPRNVHGRSRTRVENFQMLNLIERLDFSETICIFRLKPARRLGRF